MIDCNMIWNCIEKSERSQPQGRSEPRGKRENTNGPKLQARDGMSFLESNVAPA